MGYELDQDHVGQRDSESSQSGGELAAAAAADSDHTVADQRPVGRFAIESIVNGFEPGMVFFTHE